MVWFFCLYENDVIRQSSTEIPENNPKGIMGKKEIDEETSGQTELNGVLTDTSILANFLFMCP